MYIADRPAYPPGTHVRVTFPSGVYAHADLPRLALDGRVGVVLGACRGYDATFAYVVRIGEREIWAREGELTPAEVRASPSPLLT